MTGWATVESPESPDAARTLDGGPELSEFARSFSQRAPRLAWFLGAGASAQSFVPTAEQLVDVLLRHIYCTERGVPVDSVDLGDRRERRRLHEALSGQQGLPRDDDPRFYSEVFERAFPSPGDRATFIESQVRDARPNYGHHVLAALVANNSLRLVVTTNFDPLIERAINPVLDGEFFDGRQLEIADLDNPSRATRALANERWPLVVKLHGDYRSDHLKNITTELREQDEALRHSITGALAQFGLVVVGYSGRDESVVRMLRDALTSPTAYPAGLFWVMRPQDRLAPSVEALLADARLAGVEASILVASSFVDLTTRIEHAIAMPSPVRQWLSAKGSSQIRRAEPSPVGQTGAAPVIQLNALPVEQLPSEARSLAWDRNSASLGDLRAALRDAASGRDREAMVGMANGTPVAFGSDAVLSRALADVGVRVTDGSRSLNIGTDDSHDVDTQAVGIVTDALVVGLARQRGLGPVLRRYRPHQLRILRAEDAAFARLRRACGGELRGSIYNRAAGLELPWAEAIDVQLERRHGQWWLLLDPRIWTRREPLPREGALPPTPVELDAIHEQRRKFTQERTARRYNRQMGEIMEAWLDVLTGGQRVEIRTFALQTGEGVDAIAVLDGSAGISLPLLARNGS